MGNQVECSAVLVVHALSMHAVEAHGEDRSLAWSCGASIYQDIVPRGVHFDSVTVSVWVRNDSSGTQPVNLLIWELDAPGGSIGHSKQCWIPAGPIYHNCSNTVTVGDTAVRVQLYNDTPGNISVDNFRLFAND